MNKFSPAPDISPQSEPNPEVSIILPVFNERANLKILHGRITEVMHRLALSYEVLYVDDGSLDGSLEVLKEIARQDPHAQVIEFVRNFGQTAAIAAGFDHGRGDIIIPMDADLQNDPRDIPRILEKLKEGYDVVSCWRKTRRDGWLRVQFSRMANRLISLIAGIRLHDYGCTLKGYRSSIVQHIRLYGEMHRFIPVLAHSAGARVAELEVRHHPRSHGVSKYGFSRTAKVVLDLITLKFMGSFLTKPMHFFGGGGILAMACGTVLSAVTLYDRIALGIRAHRNPLLLLSLFSFIVGIQFIFFGLLAELVTRTYHESQSKATYILRDPGTTSQAAAARPKGGVGSGQSPKAI